MDLKGPVNQLKFLLRAKLVFPYQTQLIDGIRSQWEEQQVAPRYLLRRLKVLVRIVFGSRKLEVSRLLVLLFGGEMS